MKPWFIVFWFFLLVTILPNQAANADVVLKCDSSCTTSEQAELPLLQAQMNSSLASSCFTGYFLAPGLRLDMANGLAPGQILSKLREPASLTVSYFYTKWTFTPWPHITKEEGFEDPSDYSTIHFNRYYTQGWTLVYKASLGLHEMSHTKGFMHNGNAAPPNYFTIPYQVNHATEQCGK